MCTGVETTKSGRFFKVLSHQKYRDFFTSDKFYMKVSSCRYTPNRLLRQNFEKPRSEINFQKKIFASYTTKYWSILFALIFSFLTIDVSNQAQRKTNLILLLMV